MDYFVKVDEFNVRYLKLGKGDNLIFLHGTWNYSKTYMKLLKELSKKYAVYALDLPGFGKTNRPNIVWTYEDYAKFLYKFVKELKLNKFLLIGHSGSGGVAIMFASKYSKLIKKLVLIDSIGVQEKISFFTFVRVILLKALKEIFSFRGLMALKLMLFSFLNNFFRNGFYIFKVIKKNKDRNLDDYIKKIKINTLLLWGEKDEYFPLSHAKKFKDLLNNSELRIVRGNHDWCLIYPEKIKGFL